MNLIASRFEKNLEQMEVSSTKILGEMDTIKEAVTSSRKAQGDVYKSFQDVGSFSNLVFLKNSFIASTIIVSLGVEVIGASYNSRGKDNHKTTRNSEASTITLKIISSRRVFCVQQWSFKIMCF